MRIIDLTHTVKNNIQVYPGDTPPALNQTHSLERDGFTNYTLTTGMHVGTHIDGPLHMAANNKLISDLPLDCLIGKACTIDISGEKEFNNPLLLREKAKGCDIVLFYTGFEDFYGTAKYENNYPLLGLDVANELVFLGIKMIGIDTFSPDVSPYHVHKTLLKNEILIAENLTNLHVLLEEPAIKIIALPMKIAADSAPARIIALLD